MAQQKTESMDKAVHCEIMRLLRERVNDPTDPWEWFSGLPQKEWVAGDLLKGAYYLDENGRITLAGMDYHRQQTAKPIPTWIKSNWFAVAVAVATVLAAVCGPFFDFLWGIVLP
jgi:hypothetical protein